MKSETKRLLWLLVLIPVAAFSPLVTCGKCRVRGPASRELSLLYDAVDIHPPTHHHQRNIVVLSHNISQDVVDGFFDINDLLIGQVDVLARCASSALWVSNGIREDTSVFLMLFPHNITIEIQGANVQGLNPNERTMALYIQRTLLIGGKEQAADVSEAGSDSANKRQDEELLRLKEKKRQRPETVNPHKPGGLSKSEKKRLSDIRKGREAMIRRINKASSGTTPPPGFILHRDDSLRARLDIFSEDGLILMLSEIGEPLSDVLDECNTNEQRKGRDERTTTFILGNQLGYSADDEKLLSDTPMLRQVSLGPLSLLPSQCMTITHHYLDGQTATQ